MADAGRTVLGAAAGVLAVAVAVWLLLGGEGANGPSAGGAAERGRAGAVPGSARRPVSVRRLPPAAGTDRAPPASAAPRRGVVRGRVVDPDGEPVTGGTLSARCLAPDGTAHPIPGGNGVLGADGAFEVLGCAGTVCLDMHHAAFVRDGPWEVPPGSGPVTLRARPLSRLEGRVVGPDGEPVAGATVAALAGEGTDPHALPPFTAVRTSTDADGRFTLARIERPPCDVCDEAADRCHDAGGEIRTWSEARLTAWSEGYPPAEAVVDPLDDGPVALRLPRPEPPIRGTVEGAVPDGAYVLARSEVRPYEVHRGDVAPSGRFAVEGLGDGPYTLRLLAGRRELARRGGVRAGASVVLRPGPDSP